MEKQRLIGSWKKEEKFPFKGWDFFHIESRTVKDKIPWNYDELVMDYIKTSKSMLDMGTGGGEKLSKLGPFPKHTAATEGYQPNVILAKKRLGPLGIKVVDTNKIPYNKFKANEFDLIINCHDYFEAEEVFRMLKPNGVFITQQVAGDDLNDLIKIFNKQRLKKFYLANTKEQLNKAGFEIVRAQEWKGKFIFKDVGALVYYLKAIPWIVENFSVDNNIKELNALQKQLDNGKELLFTQSRFLIIAVKK